MARSSQRCASARRSPNAIHDFECIALLGVQPFAATALDSVPSAAPIGEFATLPFQLGVI